MKVGVDLLEKLRKIIIEIIKVEEEIEKLSKFWY